MSECRALCSASPNCANCDPRTLQSRVSAPFSAALAETNRKCPRWAEFNQGTPSLPTPGGAPAASPPATSPTTAAAGGSFSLPNTAAGDPLFSPGAGGSGSSLRPGNPLAFAGAHGPSPLATSPPVMAMDEDMDEDEDADGEPATPSGAPKIKLTLGIGKKA